jgi:hypothetical protein
MQTRFRQILIHAITTMALAGTLPVLASPAHAQLVGRPRLETPLRLAFPDLVVQGFRLGVDDQRGPFLIFSVKNIGTAPAGVSLTHVEIIRLLRNGASSVIQRDTRDLPTPALKPGETATLFVFGFGNAETRFEITVDALDQLVELSERNNVQVIGG